MLRNLDAKFFAAFGGAALLFAVVMVYRETSFLKRHDHDLVARQAELLLTYNFAIRHYVADTIRPIARRELGEDVFIPELMSTSYICRKIHDEVHAQFPGTVLRFASDNPRNQANLARADELAVLDVFSVPNRPSAWEGWLQHDGARAWCLARPRFARQDCLSCHSDPQHAPASLIERYGAEAGFGYHEGDLLGVDIAGIQTDRIQSLWRTGAVDQAVFWLIGHGLMCAIVMLIFRRFVTGRLQGALGAIAEVTAAERSDAELLNMKPLPVRSTDEIGEMTERFNRMMARFQSLALRLQGEVSVRAEESAARARALETSLKHLERQIDERRRSEQSRDMLAAAVEQAAESIVVTDTHGRLEHANPAFERATGYTREQARRERLRILPPAESDPQAAEMWARLKEGATWSGHLETERRDGSVIEEEVTVSPIRDADGGIVHYVAVKRDISREIRIEAQLRQAHKMEAVGRLAGGIAHDFNNLLTAITGYADILARRHMDDTFDASQVREIRKASQRATALTRQLLAFSRRQPLAKQRMDLNRVVEDVVGLLLRLLPEHVELTVALHHEPAFIRGDRHQIEQVILNLAINASDAMPRGGRLVIATSEVQMDEAYASSRLELEPGRYAALSVIDNGHGMDEDTMSHIFEPFFTTKGEHEGTGLGLATVYGIVKQSGGDIMVHSEVDQGTTFQIFLPTDDSSGGAADDDDASQPRDPDELERAHARPAPEDTPAGLTALLVEDEEVVRDLVSQILARAGYKVLTARDGIEALDLMQRRGDDVDLVVSDLVMPQMSGRDLVDHLRRDRPHLRVLFISGYADEIVIDQISGVTQSDFLQKPFSADALLGSIRRLLDEA